MYVDRIVDKVVKWKKVTVVWEEKIVVMVRQAPRYRQRGSSAASDVYIKQFVNLTENLLRSGIIKMLPAKRAVSYTHLRAHESRHDLVCRLLLE